MYKLKLVKALSYSGIVNASTEHPYVETIDPAIAEAAVATGYFKLISDTSSSVPETPSEPEPEEDDSLFTDDDEETPSEPEPEEDGKALEDMTVAELETFATYNNISLKGCKNKAAKVEKLMTELGIQFGQKVTYGSPTMVDLES